MSTAPEMKKNVDAVEDVRLGVVPPELAALDDEEEGSDLPSLAEVGRVLPIGYRDETGKIHREFEIVEWDWDVEEELGELAEKNQDMPMGEYVSEIVGRGLLRLGEFDFSKLKRSQRRLIVSKMFHADALYVYVHVRIAALGPRLKFEVAKCEGCPRRDPFVGDLNSLEVKVQSGDEIPRRTVELEKPLVYGKSEATGVVVEPLRWAFMETSDPTVLTNPAKFRLRTLRFGVVGLEGHESEAPVVLTREHAKKMGPRAVNRIVGAIDEIGGGAVMECAGRCVACGTEFRKPIDWMYDSFFGDSSR
jgi:hypothetical protein